MKLTEEDIGFIKELRQENDRVTRLIHEKTRQLETLKEELSALKRIRSATSYEKLGRKFECHKKTVMKAMGVL